MLLIDVHNMQLPSSNRKTISAFRMQFKKAVTHRTLYTWSIKRRHLLHAEAKHVFVDIEICVIYLTDVLKVIISDLSRFM